MKIVAHKKTNTKIAGPSDGKKGNRNPPRYPREKISLRLIFSRPGAPLSLFLPASPNFCIRFFIKRVLKKISYIAKTRKKMWDAGKMKKRAPGLAEILRSKSENMGPWEIAFSVLPSLGPAFFFLFLI